MSFIYLQNPNSEGGRALAASVGLRRIRHTGSTFRGGPNKKVVNWGSSRIPEQVSQNGTRIFNVPEAVRRASNKRDFFSTVSSELTVPSTTEHSQAMTWLEEGSTVIARTVLSGHSGEGIVIMDPNDPSTFVQAPLYTKYVKKRDEYRIHVCSGRVISVQRKALSEELLNGREPNWLIRNHSNGFIFAREGVTAPQDVVDKSIQAVRELGLDFGAVDVIYNTRHGRGYILEVNTAPGLVGTTLEDYTRAIQELIG